MWEKAKPSKTSLSPVCHLSLQSKMMGSSNTLLSKTSTKLSLSIIVDLERSLQTPGSVLLSWILTDLISSSWVHRSIYQESVYEHDLTSRKENYQKICEERSKDAQDTFTVKRSSVLFHPNIKSFRKWIKGLGIRSILNKREDIVLFLETHDLEIFGLDKSPQEYYHIEIGFWFIFWPKITDKTSGLWNFRQPIFMEFKLSLWMANCLTMEMWPVVCF